jgi:hypothetical protein
LELTPWKKLETLRNMVDVMEDTSVQVLEEKKNAIAQGDDVVLQQVGQGKDLLSVLCVFNAMARLYLKLTNIFCSASEHGGFRRRSSARVRSLSTALVRLLFHYSQD